MTSATPLRVLLAGATGYIGKQTAATLIARGHRVVCLLRPGRPIPPQLAGAEVRFAEVTRELSFGDEQFDATISCLATRSGAPKDSWLVEKQANSNLLRASQAASVKHFVLLSAICVQKPVLAFQQAKLAFEKELIASGLRYSIVRPTAFFKSLSGQIEKVRRGAPFLMFGDGELTSCKPISEADLANFLTDCLTDDSKWNSILPIGGPGPAITPKQQGALLFELLGLTPRYRRVPVGLLSSIISLLSTLGSLIPKLRDKAELARIGRYYATESMLVLDSTGNYDAEATPSYGQETLESFYRRVLKEGLAGQELYGHAVFSREP